MLLAVVAALLLATSGRALPVAAASQPERYLVLGQGGSPVVRLLTAGNPRVLAGAVIGAVNNARARGAARLGAFRAQVRGLRAVVADVQEVPPLADNLLLLDAARAERVPIVLENADSQKMASLLGIGTDARVVVVKGRSISNGTIHVWPAEADRFEEGETTSGSSEAPERLRPAGPGPETEYAWPEARQPPDPAPLDDPALASRVAEVIDDDGDARGPTSRAAGLYITGECQESTYCWEWATRFEPHALAATWSQIDTQLAIGLYATKAEKLLLIRSQGRVVARLREDSNDARGYYLERTRVRFATTERPAGWVLAQTSPQSANRNVTVETSSAFTFGVSGSTPEASFTQGEATSVDLREWSAVNRVRSPVAEWDYLLRATPAGDYEAPDDLVTHEWSCRARLARLPAMSALGHEPLAEAVWSGPPNSVGVFSFDYKWELALQLARFTKNNCIRWSMEWFPWSHWRSGSWTVDTGRVSAAEPDES